jgi:alkylation response protein AidB-like acyl-CoA dehydrogenase
MSTPVKHAVVMSPAEQAKAIDIARQVAAEFDKVGAEADATNRFMTSLVPIFKDSGLVELNVPREYGGMGADIWTTVQVCVELAKGDPASALAFNMHLAMCGIFRGLLTEADREKWFTRIVNDKQLVCGTLSEERAGLAGLADTTAVPLPDGRWKISGKKTWGTLCEGADIVSMNATITDTDGVLPADFMAHACAEHLFMFGMNTPGVSIQRTWDTLGMRGTGTQTVVYEDVIVPADACVSDYRNGLFGEFEWAALTFAGIYHGLLEKAYAATVEILLKKSLGATQEGANIALKDIGFVQYGLGQMLINRETSARTLEMTCKMVLEGRDLDWTPAARIPQIDIAKVVATENALSVVDQGMRLVGGSAFRRGHVLERLYRDARSGPFQPITTDQVYDLMGRSELGFFG